MHRLNVALVLCSLAALSSRALAVVETEMPLAKLLQDSNLVAVVKVERLDRTREQAILSVERILKGDEPLTKIAVTLNGNGGEGHPQAMLARIDNGTRLVVFISHLSPEEHQLFAYFNGSWFKLRGTGQGETIRGQFQQGEPYLRKTFHGDGDELVRRIEDFLAGTGKLPDLDPQAQPGLGPTLHDLPALASTATSSANEIELGPAWQADGTVASAPRDNTSGNYVVAGLLAIAIVGLVVMLTRSLPGGA